ncbi:MAG: asparaginase [Halalkalicoccus sp.]
MPPTVSVLATGGTIASTSGEEGAEPTESGAALVEAVPDLESYAEIRSEEVAHRPSFELTFEDAFDLVERTREVAREADGVVVTHGTDTMEESAYLLDLVGEYDAPVIFTGAQRPADEVSADGPANLLAAVRTAADERFADGVYIAFDEEVHAARDATKAHTSKLEAFESPGTGPVAALTRESVRVHREPGSRSPTVPIEGLSASVEIVNSGLGVGAGPVERALEAGADGIVLSATGLGNTTRELGDAIAGVVDRGIPVVVASRCHAGATAGVYGTPGGGATLERHGAIFAGDLRPHKARLKLLVALSHADGPDEVRECFEEGR